MASNAASASLSGLEVGAKEDHAYSREPTMLVYVTPIHDPRVKTVASEENTKFSRSSLYVLMAARSALLSHAKKCCTLFR